MTDYTRLYFEASTLYRRRPNLAAIDRARQALARILAEAPDRHPVRARAEKLHRTITGVSAGVPLRRFRLPGTWPGGGAA